MRAGYGNVGSFYLLCSVMEYSPQEIELIIQELKIELNGHFDGMRKNLIAASCPYCGKKDKFAVYIGKPTAHKPLFASNCFSCQHKNRDLEPLLQKLGRTDLIFQATTQVDTDMDDSLLLIGDSESKEIDDSLDSVELPKGYKRCTKNAYLKKRGFNADDYVYFPCGTTRNLNFKYDPYVIFEVIDDGKTVGWVGRHTWSKERIDEYNRVAKRAGKYIIRRYNNSTENEFSKLLYNYDTVIEGETDTVILVEGIFDAIALTRKMELYDNTSVAVVATFGKKISDIQIYKLQCKQVKKVVIAYDGDAVRTIKEIAKSLKTYFTVYIADINGELDFDEMSYEEIYDTFAYRLKTPIEYQIGKL